MAKLTEKKRAQLPKSAFAYIDSHGRRRLPIYDEPHVRSALGRFNQVAFESDAARDQARTKLLRAARKFGVLPVGFIEAQLRTERRRGHADAQARQVKKLPSGTVTFLMTDIEGSTSLLAELGVEYAALMADVRRLLRDKVRRAGGHEVEVHADEFLAAFAEAPAALDAAIGIHRGHPTVTETGYIGLSVHAVSRVCQAAHGGQILVSRSAHEAMTDELPDDVTFRSLGRRRLRGFPRPDVIYQVLAPDLPKRFPRLRTSLSRA